jgi:hypothetical protein
MSLFCACVCVRERERDSTGLAFWYTEVGLNVECYMCFEVPKFINIRGDSGGIGNTLGNDGMCDSKQKSSYEHGSDFERLPRLW